MARKKRNKELSMRKIREILRLSMQCGMKNREIARSCTISHTVVNDYLRRLKESGISSHAGVEKMDDNELRRLLKGNDQNNRTEDRPLPDWGWIHKEKKKKGVTLQLLWQEYKEIHPDGYQLSQFYEHYNRWKKNLHVSLRQTHKAGEKMFVDYAGGTVAITDRYTGKTKEAQIFVAVLGASNYTYAEGTWTQGLSDWIGSHIRAFEYFAGVPAIVVPDNLKSAITKACRYEPDINPTYHEMAVHYGTAVMPARVRKPKDKAKAETGVQVVQRWILASLRNRTFFSLSELNKEIFSLLGRLNKRSFKKLKGSRRSWFETMEREALRPLPQSRYVFAQWKKARVNIDYHVELNRHYYSVPYRLVHEEVQLRYTSSTVEVFYRGKRIAGHRRDDRQGQHSTQKEHMPMSHRQYLQWTPSRIIQWAGTVGEAAAEVVRKIIQSRRHPEQGYRSCFGIMRLGKRYGTDRLEAACKRAIAIGGCSYRSIKSILDNGLDRQPSEKTEKTYEPISHDNIRGDGYYAADLTDHEKNREEIYHVNSTDIGKIKGAKTTRNGKDL
jgi:transposase